MFRLKGSLAAAFVLLGAAPASAQGIGVQHVNFESPVQDAVAVAVVGSTTVLLAVNSPDNALEVYDTSGNVFLHRIPTGQLPVTVVVRPASATSDGDLDDPVGGPGEGGGSDEGPVEPVEPHVGPPVRVYVANWLGDSVTAIDLFETPGGTRPVGFSIVRTQYVGDEPVGIAILPENPSDPLSLAGGLLHNSVLVTFSAQQSWGWFYPDSLEPIVAGLTNRIEILHDDTTTSPTTYTGVRDPRAIAFAPAPAGGGAYAEQLWILNHRGGNDSAFYDFDLWGTNNLITSATTGLDTLPAHGGLGSTNHSMAFAPNGDLYVVGILARNKDGSLSPNPVEDPLGEPKHLAMVTGGTGFVTSFLARVQNLTSATPTIDFLDLNDVAQGTGSGTQQAAIAITNPTSVVVYGSGAPGATRVFVTGYHSDTIAMIEPTAGAPTAWTVSRVDLAHPTNAFTPANTAGIMRGPRSLALRTNGATSRHRLYVYNRLENSVSVIDPNFPSTTQPAITTFSMQGLIEPAHVVAGRKFLYSSKLSGRGNVSCASCHIDGNTDFLAWNLSDNVAVPIPGAPGSLPGALGPNSNIKGPMVTQTLRGLVNFEVADDLVQDTFYSNRPYHWRGDRGIFEQFNGAFVNLMGLPAEISATDMQLYRDFAFSIHYPPNPEQPWTRVYSGEIFDPANPPVTPMDELLQINNPFVGSGGLLGLKAFHTSGILSCALCHSLPDGSNNRLTDAFGYAGAPGVPMNDLETAQTKGLSLKETRLRRRDSAGILNYIPSSTTPANTHEFGLVHTGKSTLAGSVGGAASAFGALDLPDFLKGFGLPAPMTDGLDHFMREFDRGVAPLVGFSSTVDYSQYNVNPTGYDAAIAAFEGQIHVANAGSAVHAWLGGALRGFWYDETDSSTPYHEMVQTGVTPVGNLSRAGLLAYLDSTQAVSNPGNWITPHYTPLGDERRVSRIQGGLAPSLGGGAPTNVVLLPCVPNTANSFVTRMVLGFLQLVTDPLFFVSGSLQGGAPLMAQSWYERSLLAWAPSGFGLDRLRHDPPRRFRVQGDGIRQGAWLFVSTPTAADIATVPTTAPFTAPTTTPSTPWVFALPLFPARDAQGALVWETAAEMEPLYLMSLMNGGPGSVQVVNAFFNPLDPAYFDNTLTPPFRLDVNNLMEPERWNWHYVQVANEPLSVSTLSAGSWQRITLQ